MYINKICLTVFAEVCSTSPPICYGVLGSILMKMFKENKKLNWKFQGDWNPSQQPFMGGMYEFSGEVHYCMQEFSCSVMLFSLT